MKQYIYLLGTTSELFVGHLLWTASQKHKRELLMSKPIFIGKYRNKEIVCDCFYFEDNKYAVAEKIVSKSGTGKEVCRVGADSKEQAKEELEEGLNWKVGEGGVWE